MNAVERARQLEDRFRVVQGIDEISERVAWANRQAERLRSTIETLIDLLGPVEELVGEGQPLSVLELTTARGVLEEIARAKRELGEDATKAGPQDAASLVVGLEGLASALLSWCSREWRAVLEHEDVPALDEEFITKLEDAGIKVGSLEAEISRAQSRIEVLRMRERPEVGSISRLHEAAAQLRAGVAKLQHLLPEDVFRFVAAAVDASGADLSLLTEDVREFLSARNMQDRYRIILR